MKTLTAERRAARRAPAAHPVTIYDSRGRVLARGRTTDISESGLFMVATGADGPPRAQRVTVEVSVPATKAKSAGGRQTRTVRYLAKVVRRQSLGQMFGLGLEFIEKLT